MPKINSSAVNARVSYKGRSIIIDYEFKLHHYALESEYRKEGIVPVEMYPYGDDVVVGYIPVDERFGVADIEKIVEWAEEVLAVESTEGIFFES